MRKNGPFSHFSPTLQSLISSRFLFLVFVCAISYKTNQLYLFSVLMNQFLRTALRWVIPRNCSVLLAVWFMPYLVNENIDRNGLEQIEACAVQFHDFRDKSKLPKGVNPAILKTRFVGGGEWLNFSFNLSSSPWNKAYTRAILLKIECSITEGSPRHFLLFVDPWSMDELVGQGTNSFMKQPWFDPCSLGHGKWKFIQHTSNPLRRDCEGEVELTYSLLRVHCPVEFLAGSKKIMPKKNGIDANGWLPNSRMKTAARVNKDITSKVGFYRKNKHPWKPMARIRK